MADKSAFDPSSISEAMALISRSSDKTGRSVAELVKEMKKWQELGYSLTESASLASASLLYADVFNKSNAAAISEMDAALKRFNQTTEGSVSALEALKSADFASILSASITKSADNAQSLADLEAKTRQFQQSLTSLPQTAKASDFAKDIAAFGKEATSAFGSAFNKANQFVFFLANIKNSSISKSFDPF